MTLSTAGSVQKTTLCGTYIIFFYFFLELYEKENDEGEKFIYWNVNFVFPLANRDVSFLSNIFFLY